MKILGAMTISQTSFPVIDKMRVSQKHFYQKIGGGGLG